MRALRARTKLFQRGLAVLILPISIVPFLLIGPSLVESHHIFKREHDSGPLAAPQVVLSPGELAYFKPLPAFSGKVPVVAYGGLSQKAGSNELTQ